MAKFKGGNVTFEMFFDRAKVLGRLQQKEVRVLSGTGAFGMRTVRNSMRPGIKKGTASQPGMPPRAYGREPLKQGTFFGYDKSTHSVVIGPIRRSSKAKNNVPLTLEHGGTAPRVLLKFVDKRKKRRKRGEPKPEDKVRFVRKTIQIKPRPYVGPESINYPKIMDKFRQLIERNKLL